MKKIVFAGFMGALVAGPAFADGSSLTTKNYVDDGLRAVYQASKGYTDTTVGTLPTRVGALETAVGNSSSGLVADVAALDELINGDGTTSNPGLAADVSALDTQINGDGTTTNPGLAADVSSIETILNGDGTTANPGLVATVAGLSAASTTYTAGDGIAIDTTNNNTISVNAGDGLTFDATTHEVTIDGLATTQASGNTTKMYVYQNGVLTEMPVESDWATNGITFP